MTSSSKTGAQKETNADPVTGAAGYHPVGTSTGALGGGLAGAVVGAVAGPVGTAVGIAIGGVMGGLAGKVIAEAGDHTDEESYWAANYPSRPYAHSDIPYDDYAPAYRTGYEGYFKHKGQSFDEAEGMLAREFEILKRDSRLGWDRARYAARDAWDRAAEILAGEAVSSAPSRE